MVKTKRGGRVVEVRNNDARFAFLRKMNKLNPWDTSNCAKFRPGDINILDAEAMASSDMVRIGTNVVQMITKKRNQQFSFIRLEKAEWVSVCCGRFYFLKILVKYGLSKTEKTIEIMVWEGASRQVLRMTKNPVKPSSTTTTTEAVSQQNFEDLVQLVLFEADDDRHNVHLVHLISAEEDEEKRADVKGAAMGWFKFRTYKLTMEAEPRIGDIPQPHIIITASVLTREWFQIMNDKTAESFQTWRSSILRAKPPIATRGPDGPLWIDGPNVEPISLYEGESPYYPIDLCSPQILSHVWHILEDHNYKRGKNLEYVKVVKAAITPTAGKIFNLTFQAKDQGTLKTFQIKVFQAWPFKCWKPITSLKPCKSSECPAAPQLAESVTAPDFSEIEASKLHEVSSSGEGSTVRPITKVIIMPKGFPMRRQC